MRLDHFSMGSHYCKLLPIGTQTLLKHLHTFLFPKNDPEQFISIWGVAALGHTFAIDTIQQLQSADPG